MKLTKHSGKGSQRFLPGRGALNDLLKKQRPSVLDYAKARPNVVRNGPSITGKKP